MTRNRRITLFLFGVLLGTMFVYFFMNTKNSFNTPSDVVKLQLAKNPLEYGELAKCQQNCLAVSHQEVLDLMGQGDIVFSKSEVHATPCKKYFFEGKTKDGKELNILFGWCEFEQRSMVYSIVQTGKTCDCK